MISSPAELLSNLGPPAVTDPPWFATTRFRATVVAVLAAALAAQGAVAVFARANDVANHYHQGCRLLEADPAAPADAFRYVPYPAGRAALNAALAWLPHRAFRAALYLLAVAATVRAFVLWERMAGRGRPVAPAAGFAAAVAAAALLGPWVARDLDDCGTQLLLLFLLTAGLSAAAGGRGWAAAGWLGTAVAYKATPLLVLPLAALAGRWRAAAAAGVVAAGWCLAPAVLIGWDRTVELNRGFVAVAVSAARAEEPGDNGFEPPRHKNQGLALAVARAVRTYPPGHPLHLPHPLFVQFLDLPPRAGKLLAAAAAAALLGAVGWRVWRAAGRGGGAGADPAGGWAAACLLCAVLSPVCWGSHLVLGLPAAYLALRGIFDRLARGTRPRGWAAAGLAGVAALVYAAPREVVGRELSIVALSYKPYTLAALVLVGLALAPAGRDQDGDRRPAPGG